MTQRTRPARFHGFAVGLAHLAAASERRETIAQPKRSRPSSACPSKTCHDKNNSGEQAFSASKTKVKIPVKPRMGRSNFNRHCKAFTQPEPWKPGHQNLKLCWVALAWHREPKTTLGRVPGLSTPLNFADSVGSCFWMSSINPAEVGLCLRVWELASQGRQRRSADCLAACHCIAELPKLRRK